MTNWRITHTSLAILITLSFSIYGCDTAPSPKNDAAMHDATTVHDSRSDSASPDSQQIPACTVGADQTCNDSPAVSTLWGKCEKDGTCTCTAPYIKSTSTGRCHPVIESGNPCTQGQNWCKSGLKCCLTCCGVQPTDDAGIQTQYTCVTPQSNGDCPPPPP